MGLVLSGNSLLPNCTGIRVGKDLILTAAHCVDRIDGKTFSWILYSQKANFKDVTKIKSYTIHPDYVSNGFNPIGGYKKIFGLTDDIALVQVEELPESIPIIEPFFSEDPLAGEELYTSGWGIREDGIARFGCAKGRFDDPFFQMSKQFTFTYLKETWICNGDSGGPIFIKKGNKFELIGTVFASGSFLGSCDAQTSATAINLKHYQHWFLCAANALHNMFPPGCEKLEVITPNWNY